MTMRTDAAVAFKAVLFELNLGYHAVSVADKVAAVGLDLQIALMYLIARVKDTPAPRFAVVFGVALGGTAPGEFPPEALIDGVGGQVKKAVIRRDAVPRIAER